MQQTDEQSERRMAIITMQKEIKLTNKRAKRTKEQQQQQQNHTNPPNNPQKTKQTKQEEIKGKKKEKKKERANTRTVRPMVTVVNTQQMHEAGEVTHRAVTLRTTAPLTCNRYLRSRQHKRKDERVTVTQRLTNSDTSPLPQLERTTCCKRLTASSIPSTLPPSQPPPPPPPPHTSPPHPHPLTGGCYDGPSPSCA